VEKLSKTNHYLLPLKECKLYHYYVFMISGADHVFSLMSVTAFCLSIGHPGSVFTGRGGRENYAAVVSVEAPGEHGMLLNPLKVSQLAG